MQDEAKDSAAAAATSGVNANGANYRDEFVGEKMPSLAAPQVDGQAADSTDPHGHTARGSTALALGAAEIPESLLVGNIWPAPVADQAAAYPGQPNLQLFSNGPYPYGANGSLSGIDRNFAGPPPSLSGQFGAASAFAHAGGGPGGLAQGPPGRPSQGGQKKRAITAQYNVQSYQKHSGPVGKQAWGSSSGMWPPGILQQPNMSPWNMALQQQHQQQQRGRPPPQHTAGLSVNRMSKANSYMAYGHHAPPAAAHFMPPPARFQAGNRHYNPPNSFFNLMQDDIRQGGGLSGMQEVGHPLMNQDLCQNGLETLQFDVLQNRVLDMSQPGQPDYRLESLAKGGYLLPEQDPQRLINDGMAMLEHGVANLDLSFGGPSFGLGHFDRPEHYSRKVFVGGLPPDIDEEEIMSAFRRFGPLIVDWPHKAESKSYFPPKGYCFLLFHEEPSVQALIDACHREGDKMYWCVTSPSMKDKPVQIRPWNLSDSDYVMDGSHALDPRKTIFVGGVPRPLRAVELALIMDRLYGCVCYAGIDTDPELKYPKGAGRVAFSSQQSYIAAISARFVQLQMGDIDKRVEVKPYVLDDQMCDECQGARCGAKFAPYFCSNITCLQYYCDTCWNLIHSRPGREYHKPLMKEGTERPRAAAFRWN